jgi:surface antigen
VFTFCTSLSLKNQSTMVTCLGRQLRCLFATTVVVFGLVTAATPQIEDQSHRPYKGFSWGYCTYYAAQVFDQFAAAEGGIDWRGDGGKWLRAAQEKGWKISTNPRDARVGAIIVWQNGGRGHVGIVDDVYEDGILISEMNWRINSDGDATGGFNCISQSFLPFSTNLNRGVRRRYFFVGYIFPERVMTARREFSTHNARGKGRRIQTIDSISHPRVIHRGRP